MQRNLENATLTRLALHCIKLCSIYQKKGYPIGVSLFLVPVNETRTHLNAARMRAACRPPGGSTFRFARFRSGFVNKDREKSKLFL